MKENSSMPARPGRPGSALSRMGRGLRAGLLFLAFVLTAAYCYLNQIGLPDFIARKLEAQIRSRGIDLRLDRVWLQGARVMAEGIHIGSSNAVTLADVEELEIGLQTDALKRLQLRLDALEARGARALIGSGEDSIALENAALALSLREENRWDLAHLSGLLGRTRVRVSGSLSHPLEARKWDLLKRDPTAPKTQGGTRGLRNLARQLSRIHAPDFADLDVTFSGDGRDPGSWSVAASYRLPAARASWGGVTRAEMSARIAPAPDASSISAAWTLAAESIETRPAQAEQVRGSGSATYSVARRELSAATAVLDAGVVKTPAGEAQSFRLEADTRPSVSDLKTHVRVAMESAFGRWGRVSAPSVEGDVFHSLTHLKSLQAAARLEAKKLEADLGQLETLRLQARVHRRDGEIPAREEWGPWNHLAPFDLDWNLELDGLVSPKIEVSRASIAGTWLAPQLKITKLQAALYNASIEGSARLNVETREASAAAAFDVDAHKLRELLTPAAQRWLRQFSWETAPKVEAEARLKAPAWTETRPNWRRDVLPTVTISGKFEGQAGGFRGVQADSARSHFTLTNGVWRLPDLQAERPEGRVTMHYEGSMFTQDYYWKIDSRIDPQALAPVLEPQHRKFLDLTKFETPPVVQAEIWGRWHERELLGFRGQAALTNASFRGESCSEAAASFSFTNQILRFENIALRRDQQKGTVAEMVLNIPERVIDVTNAVSTLDVNMVTKWVGPKVHAVMTPYQFAKPPSVRMDGRLPMGDIRKTNVRFAVAGEGFSYWRFRAPHLAGDVRWVGESLTISNVQASFYGGDLRWEGAFDFSAPTGSLFSFQTTATNVDFKRFMADVSISTNHMEGSLDGTLIVRSASSDDWKSWNGSGHASLRDGFVWNIPIFGFFTPILNGLAPGLGNSRATAAGGAFTIERSVIHTRDLEVRAPALRLQYAGKVDFDGNVDARVQAEILRDAWAVGRLVSLALWPVSKIFEYKVTGTLREPRTDLMHIPDFVSWPFYPLKALRKALTPEEKAEAEKTDQ